MTFNTTTTFHSYTSKQPLARLALALAALSATVMMSPLNAQELALGNWIAPGVLVNNNDGAVVLMAPEGRVEAVNISNGAVVWRSNDAAKPVALRGQNIIAQAEDGTTSSTLSLVALDRETGTLRGQDSVDLGSSVDTSIDNKPGESFGIEAGTYITENSDLYWRYFKQFIQGPMETPPPPIERFGRIQVSSDAEILPSPAGFARAAGRPPYIKPRMRRVQPENPARTIPIIDVETGRSFRLDGVPVDGTEGTVGPVDGVVSGDVGGFVASFVPPQGGLYISEGAPGTEFPPVRRLPGDQFGYASDERHILSSAFGGNIEAANPYRWRVYERSTYRVIADFTARTSFTPFIVVSDRVIYLRQPYEVRQRGRMQAFPIAVVARDTASGEIVWTRAVRDTRNKDPLPD